LNDEQIERLQQIPEIQQAGGFDEWAEAFKPEVATQIYSCAPGN